MRSTLIPRYTDICTEISFRSVKSDLDIAGLRRRVFRVLRRKMTAVRRRARFVVVQLPPRRDYTEKRDTTIRRRMNVVRVAATLKIRLPSDIAGEKREVTRGKLHGASARSQSTTMDLTRANVLFVSVYSHVYFSSASFYFVSHPPPLQPHCRIRSLRSLSPSLWSNPRPLF